MTHLNPLIIKLRRDSEEMKLMVKMEPILIIQMVLVAKMELQEEEEIIRMTNKEKEAYPILTTISITCC